MVVPKAVKGWSKVDVYYTFMELYNEEKYKECLAYLEVNKWWIDNVLPHDSRLQIKKICYEIEKKLD